VNGTYFFISGKVCWKKSLLDHFYSTMNNR